MTTDNGPSRDPRLDSMQQALEEGLQAIAAARNATEAEAARDRARARLEALAYRRSGAAVVER